MLTHTMQIRVRYAEVDQMGFLYHANYVTYFDVARSEMIRELGMSNHRVEELGYMIPVLNVNIDYGMPVHYDDVLTIKTTIRELPKVKATFFYEVFREETLLTTGNVTVAFMRSDTRKGCRPPREMMALVEPYFK